MSSHADATRLATAPLTVLGRFATASNLTLLCHLGPVPAELAQRPPDPASFRPSDLAIYKPRDGEAPLWDFPDGTLHQREVAAYELDRLLGWQLVPTTVRRSDGPLGAGAVQAYVSHDPACHYFWMVEEGPAELRPQLERMVLFDVVIDNADRKGGHVLLDRDHDRVQLVDHGVSFHVERKLRTVAWHFIGEPVPSAAREDLRQLAEVLRSGGPRTGPLVELLTPAEYRRLCERAEEAAELERFPGPEGSRPYPWPLL